MLEWVLLHTTGPQRGIQTLPNDHVNTNSLTEKVDYLELEDCYFETSLGSFEFV